MKTMSIGTRITVACGVLVAFTVILAIASLASIGGLATSIHSLQADSVPGQYTSGRIGLLAQRIRRVANRIVLSVAVKDDVTVQEQELSAQEASLREARASHDKTITGADDRQAVQNVRERFKKVSQAWARLRGSGTSPKRRCGDIRPKCHRCSTICRTGQRSWSSSTTRRPRAPPRLRRGTGS